MSYSLIAFFGFLVAVVVMFFFKRQSDLSKLDREREEKRKRWEEERKAEEFRQWLAAGIPDDAPPLQILGYYGMSAMYSYRLVRDKFPGDWDKQKEMERVILATLRRQLTRRLPQTMEVMWELEEGDEEMSVVNFCHVPRYFGDGFYLIIPIRGRNQREVEISLEEGVVACSGGLAHDLHYDVFGNVFPMSCYPQDKKQCLQDILKNSLYPKGGKIVYEGEEVEV